MALLAQMDSTEIPTKTEIDKYNHNAEALITPQQWAWIDYKAVGGLIYHDNGEFFDGEGRPSQFEKMTVEQFAKKISVDKSTLYIWMKNIPDFWGKVDMRRKVLFGGNRKTAVYNGLTLKATRGDVNAIKLYLEIFDDYQPAPQRVQHNLGDGFADAALIVAKRRAEPLEGEVVSGNATTQ
ncbi:MAG TPA: phBC6A51 family helix-turn-helix protein [Candidatus Saccharibacteria bacterium]|nr:phBC6A51 family helix-turn-helix protein [Candidatus Saccharibacteria bacterium]